MLCLQILDCCSWAIFVDEAVASYIASAGDWDVEGFAALLGRCRHGLRDEKSESDDY